MSKLSERAITVPGSIKAPATNLTLGSGVAALLAVVLTAWNDAFETIFGENVSQDIRKDVLVASIFAFAAIAVADLIARAVSNAALERSSAAVAAASVRSPTLVPAPSGTTATITTGVDDPGYMVVAMRPQADDASKLEYLLVKAGKAPQWRSEDEISIQGPGAPGRKSAT